MYILKTSITCCMLLVLTACNSETVKRTTYDTLQNIEKQQCQKDFSKNCPEQDSYDDYQKQRQQQ